MAKVTSKLQVTLPKALAQRYRIRPGDEIEWVEAGDAIRVIPHPPRAADEERIARRLKYFDLASKRQRERNRNRRLEPAPDGNRGWRREELYERGKPH